MEPDPPRFKYKPFEHADTGLRILTLLPGELGTPISCFLTQKSTANGEWPVYDALSYVWGDKASTKRIFLGRYNHYVTENLEGALQQLRLPDISRQLWIDALCINQEDDDEKSRQVRKMGGIYRHARSVLCWLGPEADESNEAMILMQDIAKWIELEHIDIKHFPYNSFTAATMREKGFDPASRNWVALRMLFNRTYWTRVWVLQELASCFDFEEEGYPDSFNGRGEIGCGASWISLKSWAVTANFLNAFMSTAVLQYDKDRSDLKPLVEPLRSMKTHPLQPATFMNETLRACSSYKINLTSMMVKTSSFQATDIRDKIYALVAVTNDQKDIIPDYSTSPSSVFQSVTKSVILNTKSLVILEGNRTGIVPEGFPSWVPEPSGPNGYGNAWQVFQEPWYEEEFGISAGHTSFIAPEFHDLQGFMVAQGWTVGKISRVIGPFPVARTVDSVTGVPNNTDDWFNRYVELIEYAMALKPEKLEKFWRTLLLDIDTTPTYTIGVYPESPVRRDFGIEMRALIDSNTIPADFEPLLGEELRHSLFIFSLSRQMGANLMNRCFVMGVDGFMGMGPMNSKPGDIMVALLSARLCFVLRETDRGFLLVGDGYVQGTVKGSLLEPKDAGFSKIEPFVLC